MAGLWLKFTPDAGADHVEIEADDHALVTHDNTNENAEKKKNKSGGGHGADNMNSDNGYMKFSRQFIVPVLDKAGVNSLVILELNIEVPSNATETIYVKEPKLRDVLLSRLLQLSNGGAFDDQITEQRKLDTLRVELLEAAQGVIGESAINILILNISRQNV